MLNSIASVSRIFWLRGQRGVFVPRIQHAYSSFTARDIIHETSDDAGTLLARFAKHIAMEQHAYLPILPRTISYANYFPLSDASYFKKELQRTPADQLPALIIFAFTYRSNADPQKFAYVINELDAAAVRQLPKMNDETALRTLYAFLFLMPNWITRTDFYRAAVKRVAEQNITEDTPKEKFVQLCFYLGLGKKQNKEPNTGMEKLLKPNLERYLPELQTLDLAVISSAAFKTSTPIQSELYNARLEDEACALTFDNANDALLITFVKAMRFHRVRSQKVCEHLTRLCENRSGLRELKNSGLVHLLAYFSENLWDQQESVQPIANEFIGRLAKSSFRSRAEPMRGKDISIFLWSCSQLNYMPDVTVLQRIEEILLEKYANNEFRYYPDILVDCCLSLWTLGYKSRELLQAAADVKSNSGPSERQQPKVDNRFTVLLTAAAIEEPKWTVNIKRRPEAPFDFSAPVPTYLLNGRSDLTAYVNKLATEEDIDEAKIVCPLKGINIPGLYVKLNNEEKTEYFVEMLTPEQWLRFSNEPIALLRLKARLLTILKYRVAMIKPHDIQENYKSFKSLVSPDTDASELAALMASEVI